MDGEQLRMASCKLADGTRPQADAVSSMTEPAF